jgi:hypothetical protein
MRKGIGKGLNLPVDNNYLGDYEPIDTRKIYCGNAENLPDGYDLMGSLPQCLQRGIGIGKKQKAENSNQRQLIPSFSSNSKQNYKIITIYILLCASIFLVLYFTKPDFISDKKNNKNIINTKKLLLYYISIIAVIGIILFIVAKFT